MVFLNFTMFCTSFPMTPFADYWLSLCYQQRLDRLLSQQLQEYRVSLWMDRLRVGLCFMLTDSDALVQISELWMQSQFAVRGEAGSEQKQQTCSSQNAQEKLQWRNLCVLADVMPLGLVKPYLCLNTALSLMPPWRGYSSTGVTSCRCLRSSGELGAGGTCRSLHLRCPELQKEPPAEECCASELCCTCWMCPVGLGRVPGHHRNAVP